MTAQQDNLEMTPLRCSYCDHHAVTWECEICERRGFDVPVPERQAEISTPIAENDNTDADDAEQECEHGVTVGQKSREFIERASASTLTKPYQSAEYWRETAEKALAEGAALEAALREEMERAQYRPEDIDEHIAGIKHSASTRRDIGQEILDGLKDLKRSQNKD